MVQRRLVVSGWGAGAHPVSVVRSPGGPSGVVRLPGRRRGGRHRDRRERRTRGRGGGSYDHGRPGERRACTRRRARRPAGEPRRRPISNGPTRSLNGEACGIVRTESTGAVRRRQRGTTTAAGSAGVRRTARRSSFRATTARHGDRRLVDPGQAGRGPAVHPRVRDRAGLHEDRWPIATDQAPARRPRPRAPSTGWPGYPNVRSGKLLVCSFGTGSNSTGGSRSWSSPSSSSRAPAARPGRWCSARCRHRSVYARRCASTARSRRPRSWALCAPTSPHRASTRTGPAVARAST